MNRLKSVFRFDIKIIHILLYTIYINPRGKGPRERFPQLMGDYSDTNSLDEVSDSFHWLLDLESSGHDHDKCPFNSTDEDIVKKRHNFAITRSRSFAHPVGISPTKPVRHRKKSSVAFVENQENEVKSSIQYDSLDAIIEVDSQISRIYCLNCVPILGSFELNCSEMG